MFVLIDDIELFLLNLLNLHFRKLLDRLLCQKQLDLIALGQMFGTVAFFSVQGNIFFPHHFINEAFSRQIQIFCQQLVQALPRLIFRYCQHPHGCRLPFLHR